MWEENGVDIACNGTSTSDSCLNVHPHLKINFFIGFLTAASEGQWLSVDES
jgi:hypothetical protein